MVKLWYGPKEIEPPTETLALLLDLVFVFFSCLLSITIYALATISRRYVKYHVTLVRVDRFPCLKP